MLKRDYTNYELTMADGRELWIGQATVGDLVRWLDDLPDWAHDEVEAVMTECCDRLGMDVEDFWDCDECFDHIYETYHDTMAKTEVEQLKLHVWSGPRVPGPLVTFKRVEADKLPKGSEPVKLDCENRGSDMDIAGWFEFYQTPDERFVCVRKEI